MTPRQPERVTITEWRVVSTGNHQALIVDERGRDIAVAYAKADAPLLASAPVLLEALKLVQQALDDREVKRSALGEFRCKAIEEAIHAAEGGRA